MRGMIPEGNRPARVRVNGGVSAAPGATILCEGPLGATNQRIKRNDSERRTRLRFDP